MYAGLFTRNDQLTASPFTDTFFFIPNVTLSVAIKVLPSPNQEGANERRALEMLEERVSGLYAGGRVDTVYSRWLEEMDRRNVIERRAATNLTLGYVTTDVRSTLFFSNFFFPPTNILDSRRRHLSYSSSV